jgi:hypothetical protein
LVALAIDRGSPGASRQESIGRSVTAPAGVVTVTSPLTTT